VKIAFGEEIAKKNFRNNPWFFEVFGEFAKKLKIYCEKSLTFFGIFVLFAPPR
jgi:hypothetical protein